VEWTDGHFKISDDKARLDIDKICALLSKSYWASNRPRETVELSVQNSICYGVYQDEEQIGFARVVSDRATMFWLCDVCVDDRFRGRGLGKKLVQCVVESEALQGLTGVLATNDAHGLYEQYGFKRVPDRYMRRSPQG
jgi:N-acetylglutamate synthase-like GNAT family acetyltransferase